MRIRPSFAVIATLSVLIALVAWPVRTGAIRATIALATATCLATLIVATWRRRHTGKVVLLATVAVAAWVTATWRLLPPSAARFTRSLVAYEHTPYHWGGETRLGIDCSGLIRMAMRDAFVREGRLGAAVHVWWVDAAARDFGTRYGDVLEAIGDVPSIRDAPAPHPGTVAVTVDGRHTLACLDGQRWIQASPGDGAVTIRHRTDPDPWFAVPVRLYRLRR